MKMRFLGRSGLKVSEICFGTMTLGGRGFWKNVGDVNQQETDSLISIALDYGVNFFDTANVYSEGLSEEMLGKALGRRRKQVVLATKVHGRMGPGPNDLGLSRHHIIEACDQSLARLQTDYIDLYQIHSFDPCTPLEETLRALDDLVRQGKVRYIGCSNLAGWQLMKALSISDKFGWKRFVTLQAFYSLIARDIENELVPVSLDQGLGILAWSPLAGGFLTGKYRRGQPRPKDARRADPEKEFLRFNEDTGLDIVDELEQVAKEHKASIAQAALNYLLRKPAVTSVIIGARTREQLEENLKAGDWEMRPEAVSRLDELSQPPRVYPYWMHSTRDR